MDKEAFLRVWKPLIIKTAVITLIFCTGYSLWGNRLSFIKETDLKIFDALYSLTEVYKGADNRANNIVLIAIDDESIRNVEVRWPWPRSFVAKVISKVSAFNPAAIAVDLIFTGKSDDPNEDFVLQEALKATDNVIAAAYFGSDGRYVMPEEGIAENVAAFGFVNKPRDIDNSVRRMRPFVVSTAGKIIDYSLSVKTASQVTGLPPEEITKHAPLMKEDDTAFIHYFGTKQSFPVISVWKILDGSADLSLVRDKIVFIGVEAEVFHDTYTTAVGLMPGVLVAANETLTYITKEFLTPAGKGLNFAILFLILFASVIFGLRLSIIHGVVINTVLLSGFLIAAFAALNAGFVLDYFGVIFLVVVLSLAIYGARYINLAVENMMLKKESITDGLTRLYGYKYFELKLKSSLKKALREGKHFALEMYDIDHFKSINDTYGHEFGNVVLKAVANVLSENSRRNDTVARFGGEEFCVLAAGSKRQHVVKHAERVRNLVKELEFTTEKDEKVKITISGGVVTTEEYISEDYLEILRAADSALYKSKETGRDRISVFEKGDKLDENQKTRA